MIRWVIILAVQQRGGRWSKKAIKAFQWGSCYSFFSFTCNICKSLFSPFFVFRRLCCLLFTDSDYRFGICKPFLHGITGKARCELTLYHRVSLSCFFLQVYFFHLMVISITFKKHKLIRVLKMMKTEFVHAW